MVQAIKAKVLSNELIAPDFYKLNLFAGSVAREVTPGQFVMVKVAINLEPFLRRPISINSVNKKEGILSLIYQVVGKGTKLMASIKSGQEIEIMGPLGQGFSWDEEDKTAVIVGGGCGIAPLGALAQELKDHGKEVYVLLGAQNKDKLICEQDFIKARANVQVATDDGSWGVHGYVTELLERLITQTKVDHVYCCGPLPMTKVVAQIAKKNSLPCQVSLEERMGCGIGACIGCVCKTQDDKGKIHYKKVCKDGPIFDSREVMFDD